jgi:hypothetical protein
MDTLLSLARRGRTVVCTIHQPNSDITSLFDDLMLLAAVSAKAMSNDPQNSSCACPAVTIVVADVGLTVGSGSQLYSLSLHDNMLCM